MLVNPFIYSHHQTADALATLHHVQPLTRLALSAQFHRFRCHFHRPRSHPAAPPAAAPATAVAEATATAAATVAETTATTAAASAKTPAAATATTQAPTATAAAGQEATDATAAETAGATATAAPAAAAQGGHAQRPAATARPPPEPPAPSPQPPSSQSSFCGGSHSDAGASAVLHRHQHAAREEQTSRSSADLGTLQRSIPAQANESVRQPEASATAAAVHGRPVFKCVRRREQDAGAENRCAAHNHADRKFVGRSDQAAQSIHKPSTSQRQAAPAAHADDWRWWRRPGRQRQQRQRFAGQCERHHSERVHDAAGRGQQLCDGSDADSGEAQELQFPAELMMSVDAVGWMVGR